MSEMDINNTFFRQSGWIDPEILQETKVMVVGCGSVGSKICTTLAKQGIGHFVLVDFDDVEEHNLPNQFFIRKEIGMQKVDALKNRIEEFSPGKAVITTHNTKFPYKDCEKDMEDCDFIILGLDNHAARKEVFKKVSKTKKILIDGRTGGRNCGVFYVEPKNIEKWAKTLNKKASDVDCTMQSIIFNLDFVSGTVSSMIFNHLIKESHLNPYMIEMNTGAFQTRLEFDKKEIIQQMKNL